MAKKILIVDDELDTLKVLENRFKKEGYDVITAADGMSCITQAKKEKPDLILLDIVLPDISGFEACRVIKSDKATQDIKVIVCTNKLDAIDATEARKSKADEFIEKLSDSALLLETVKKFI